jgi:hypothetical protein
MVMAQPSEFSKWKAPSAHRQVTDVFVDGVLSTLSAWVIWIRCPFWLGLEPGRKFVASPRLDFRLNINYEECNTNKKADRPAGYRQSSNDGV